jgi:hypothetical protein
MLSFSSREQGFIYFVVGLALNFSLKSLGVEGSSNAGLGGGGGGFVKGIFEFLLLAGASENNKKIKCVRAL